jgi:polyketide synthase PksJ
LGQVDYCGANAYLDAWAQSAAAQEQTRRISIAWGAWAETGMAVDTVAKRGYLPCPFWLESSQKQPIAREVTHPLLDQCVRETETEKAYLSDFKVSQLWVLSEHKVAGNATLPGTAYLELARAAFEDHTKTEGAEIRELFFLSPLMVADGEEKEVHVLLKKEDDGYSFRVTSKPESTDGESKLLEHARGKISALTTHEAPDLDLAELLNSLQRVEEPSNGNGSTSMPENRLVEVGPRWNCLKTVYTGANQGLALIDLSDEFVRDLDDYKIHPAMLDMAVGVAKKLTGNTGNYLPLSYKRFEMFRPFSKRIYSYIRYRDRKEGSSSAAALDFDITLLDENGARLVEIEEYTLRRVHDVALQLKGLSGKEFGKVIANDQMLAGAILTWEGVEAFKRVISRKEITQVVVSPMDIPSVIAKWMPKETNLVEEIGKAQPLRASHGRPNTGVEYVAPRNEIEAMIAEIWERLLGIEKIGVQDDFFALGGDSLLGIQVISRLREVFPVDMSPAMLFERPTIAELSNELVEQLAQKVDVESLDQLEHGLDEYIHEV